MTPEELRSLADEATPGPWTLGGAYYDNQALRMGRDRGGDVAQRIYVSKADARLIALAPDLARLCAEYAGAFEQIEKLHPKDRAESAHIARRALAKLSELQP